MAFRNCPAGLRCLSFVDRRSRTGREVEDVAVWGPARQRRRIYLMVREPALPVPGHRNRTVGPRDLHVTVRYPRHVGCRPRWGPHLRHRARRRVVEAVEDRPGRCRPACRRPHLARRDLRHDDAEHRRYAEKYGSQPNNRSLPGRIFDFSLLPPLEMREAFPRVAPSFFFGGSSERRATKVRATRTGPHEAGTGTHASGQLCTFG